MHTCCAVRTGHASGGCHRVKATARACAADAAVTVSRGTIIFVARAIQVLYH